jgi:site-specific DNA-methyltransferase (adenine-specific)
MASKPDNYYDLAVVDPPYGIGGDALHSHRALNGAGKLKNRILNTGNTKWDIAPNKDYFEELKRVSKNQIIWGGNYFPLPPTRCVICWDKMQPWENFSQWEMGWTSFDSPARLYKFDNRTGDKIHPTQKPIALYDWIFKNYAKPGMKILDTHVGSGSSRISADKAGLSFEGWELNEDYHAAQEKRYKLFKSQLRLAL